MNTMIWGETEFGTAHVYTLTAGKSTARVSDFGATLIEWKYDGTSLVLGSDELGFYLGKCGSMGASIGRFANRIAAGKFTLDGREYSLNCNEGKNHLHGGFKGFEKRLWTAHPEGDSAVTFTYVSPNGEENYPAALTVSVRYELGEDGALSLCYHATSDGATILNLTNHSYFNLGCERDILGCKVTIPADRFIETGEGSIPTGRLADVTGTVMDLRGGVVMGDRMADEYLVPTGGYDHCFVLGRERTESLHLAAKVETPNGVTLECLTDQPSVQLYCGCQLDGSLKARGRSFGRYSALCLETQVFPDSPNHPGFTNCVLRPGEVFETKTVYKVHKD